MSLRVPEVDSQPPESRTLASLLFKFEELDVGVESGRKRTRGQRSDEGDAAVPDLSAVERDRNGNVVYVDLDVDADSKPELLSLRSALASAAPTDAELQKLPLINRNRVLVELSDAVVGNRFSQWVRSLLRNSNSDTGTAFTELLKPLGNEIMLLGAHFICPRVTEYEPNIKQQQAHTDVSTKGQVVAVAVNVHGVKMNTLIDAGAQLDKRGNVVGGTGLKQANTTTFAYDTGAVHAGPGQRNVPGPFPRFLVNRVFFLLCSANLDPALIAKHREDNGLKGALELMLNLEEL
jgi:hypothetical protein